MRLAWLSMTMFLLDVLNVDYVARSVVLIQLFGERGLRRKLGFSKKNIHTKQLHSNDLPHMLGPAHATK